MIYEWMYHVYVNYVIGMFLKIENKCREIRRKVLSVYRKVTKLANYYLLAYNMIQVDDL